MTAGHHLHLDPDQAIRSGQVLATAAEQITRVRETHGADITAANRTTPWGNDDLGRAFTAGSDGQPDYPITATKILDVWLVAARAAIQVGDNMVTSAESLTVADRSSSERVHHARQLRL